MEEKNLHELKNKLSEQNRENSIFVPLVQNLLVILLPTIFLSIATAIGMYVLDMPVLVQNSDMVYNSVDMLTSFIVLATVLTVMFLFRAMENRYLPMELKKSNVDIIVALVISICIIIFQISAVELSRLYLTIVGFISLTSLVIGALLTYIRFSSDESIVAKFFYNMGKLASQHEINRLKQQNYELSLQVNKVSDTEDSGYDEAALIQLRDDAILIYKTAASGIKPTTRVMANNYNMGYDRWKLATDVLTYSNIIEKGKVIQKDFNIAKDKIINYILETQM